MTDESLLLAVAGADELALKEISLRYAPFFRAMLRRMTTDLGEVEEWLQEIFVRVWEKAGHFDPTKAGATTWLVTVARRVAVERLRKRRGSQLDGVPESPDLAQRRRVSETLGRLDAEPRHMFELAFFGGYTHEEIAELTKKAPESVGKNLQLALVQLHEFLAVAPT